MQESAEQTRGGPASRRLKRGIAALACGALLVGTAACGSDSDDGGGSGDSGDAKGGGSIFEKVSKQAPPSTGPRGNEDIVSELEITPKEAAKLKKLAAEGPMTFGFSTHIYPHPYWNPIVENWEKAIKEYFPDSEFVVTSNDLKPEKQQADIEGLLNQGVDVMTVGVLDQAAVVPALIEVNKQKVPLILALTAMEDPAVEYQGFCGGDGYRGSWLAGAYLADQLGGEGDVASVEFTFDVWHNRMRNKGFEDAAKAGGLNVAARAQATANDDADTTFQNVLTGNPGLAGAFGLWDGVALGMAQAATGQGRDDVAIVTHDITTPSALSIRDGGPIKASAVTLLDQMGKLCGQVVLKHLAGTDMTRVAALAPEVLAKPENVEELHKRFVGKSIDEAK